ncbi:polysaccharide biosynthesis tyrosine autokinase [Klebsiella quasivariicola]|uniref:polysaccharide biosynthesis tyrosine autokinase n=1 Tax=Klebsiella quasivariicola TaxID=2026240 RepID=UPI001CCBD331|nr:polysaccharide biosynthesis tyrosine autokinase [Klebsiella quasivariicola]MBZ9580444.1 polysaccharide biosynthesis tyrosine autokinase [Klebsiella quasivariicola]
MSQMSKKASVKDEQDINLGRIIGELIDHKKLIIAITSLFTLIALVYAVFATPIYQADALIQVEQKQGNAILNNISQMLPDSQPISAPEIALLQSRMVIGKTVDDLNLQAIIERKYFPLFGKGWARLKGENPGALKISRLYIAENVQGKSSELSIIVKDNNHYEVIFNDHKLNGEVGKLVNAPGFSINIEKIDASKDAEFTVTYVSKLQAITDLQNSFSVVDQGKDTGMLTLSLAGSNVELIKNIVDSISQNYLAQNIARQAAQDAKSLDFLNQQLPKVRSELDIAEDKLNQYRRQKDSVDLSLEAKSVLDQIVNVDNQLNELTFRESEISQLYTKEHPTYKALMEKRKTLQEERNKLNQKVSSMPKTQQEILRLSRDVESGQAVYMQLLNRQQELSIAKSSAIGNVRIIDSAVTQPEPVKPKKLLVIILGLLIGGIISIAVVVVRTVLRRGIESPEQLEELGINVYASIPVSETINKETISTKNRKDNNKTSFLAIENPADLAIEAIRGLRTSLHFAMMEARNNVLMISGASPNAGKTFVSTNLAAVIAQTGKKVLFIDTDMRKGYTHKLFNTKNAEGLSDYLAGRVELSRVTQTLGIVNFDYISRGSVPPNPAELLMHSRFSDLIAWACSNYDIVILDTPPILAVTDAAIIGNYVGTTLLVARFELNTPREMDISVKRFEQSGVVVKGCILNGIVKRASNYYNYGYNHYGYSYDEKK